MVGERYHSQVGLERGKGIISDFRPGGRDHRQQSALACVRLTNQADVGEELQDQFNLSIFSRLSGLPFAGSLVSWCGKSSISPAATPASSDPQGLSRGHDFTDQLAGCRVSNHRTGGNWQI